MQRYSHKNKQTNINKNYTTTTTANYSQLSSKRRNTRVFNNRLHLSLESRLGLTTDGYILVAELSLQYQATLPDIV